MNREAYERKFRNHRVPVPDLFYGVDTDSINVPRRMDLLSCGFFDILPFEIGRLGLARSSIMYIWKPLWAK